MTVMLSSANAKLLGSAINWGFVNAAQAQAMGISAFNLTGLKGRIGRSMPLDPCCAEAAYRLLYVAEPELSYARDEVTDVLAKLTAIASPLAIEQSAARFTTCATFMKAFKARLGDAMDAVDCVNPIDITNGYANFGRPDATSYTDLPAIDLSERELADSAFVQASEPWWAGLGR